MENEQTTWQTTAVGQFTPAQLLQNQIQAAMLSENLIDELMLTEEK